jgi:uncharacterized membrane protein
MTTRGGQDVSSDCHEWRPTAPRPRISEPDDSPEQRLARLQAQVEDRERKQREGEDTLVLVFSGLAICLVLTLVFAFVPFVVVLGAALVGGLAVAQRERLHTLWTRLHGERLTWQERDREEIARRYNAALRREWERVAGTSHHVPEPLGIVGASVLVVMVVGVAVFWIALFVSPLIILLARWLGW